MKTTNSLGCLKTEPSVIRQSTHYLVNSLILSNVQKEAVFTSTLEGPLLSHLVIRMVWAGT